MSKKEMKNNVHHDQESGDTTIQEYIEFANLHNTSRPSTTPCALQGQVDYLELWNTLTKLRQHTLPVLSSVYWGSLDKYNLDKNSLDKNCMDKNSLDKFVPNLGVFESLQRCDSQVK